MEQYSYENAVYQANKHPIVHQYTTFESLEKIQIHASVLTGANNITTTRNHSTSDFSTFSATKIMKNKKQKEKWY